MENSPTERTHGLRFKEGRRMPQPQLTHTFWEPAGTAMSPTREMISRRYTEIMAHYR